MPRPGFRSLLRLVAFAAAGGLVAAACAGSGYHYVKNSDDRTYFKVPESWKLYDEHQIIDTVGRSLSAREKRSQLDTSWRVAFDGSPKPSLGHLFNPKAKSPSGMALVLDLSFQDTDGVSLQALRNFFFDVDTASQNNTGQVLSYEPVELDGGFHGIHIVATIDDKKGQPLTFNQKSVLDQSTSKLYTLVVGCDSACYDKNQSKIEQVVDSWTVKES